jgi:hypothetical protein
MPTPRDLYFINSRHDPYGCDDKQGRAMFERLGGTQIVRDDGHFDAGDLPYETFELLDKLIDCGQTERAGSPSAAVRPSLGRTDLPLLR